MNSSHSPTHYHLHEHKHRVRHKLCRQDTTVSPHTAVMTTAPTADDLTDELHTNLDEWQPPVKHTCHSWASWPGNPLIRILTTAQT